eukprot:g1534.t1
MLPPKPVQRDPVQKHDVCDEVFGAFVASVARKIHSQREKPSSSWRKLLPVLMHAVAGYDEGNMQEHILENIVTAFNNLCKGNSGSSREYRRYFVQLGGVELLFELLEKSLSGYVSAKIRFHTSQCLQFISIEEDLRGRVGTRGNVATVLKVIYSVQNGHSVKAELFGILMNLAVDESCAKAVLREDGLHLIKQSLNCRPSQDKSVVLYACGLVANIAVIESLKLKLCKAGILAQLQKICCTQSDLLILVNAVTAIKNLVHDDSKAAKLCAKSGGVKALRQALKKIESSVDIQSLVDNPTVWLPYLIDHVRLAKVATRKALIIANDYDDITHPWRSLMSSKDNANAMKEVLERAGFDVHMLINISKKQVITAVKRFSSLLSSGDTCLVYFYGFGCRISGFNFLRPVDVPSFSRNTEMVSHLYSFENMMNMIESRVGERGTKMFLLECPVDKYIEKSLNRISRNSIKESSNTTTNGIPNVGAINLRTVGKNWYIMSSTSDPIPAFDDDKPGQYSAFTHSLFCGIDEKALDLSNFGKFVNRKFSSTLNSLEGVSIPIVASSLMRDFYFHGNIKTRNKQAEDDQWEIEEEMKREKTAQQQRYNGLRVLSMRKKNRMPNTTAIRAASYTSKNRKPPSPPPGPPGSKKYAASPRVGMLYHGKNSGPLSKDAAIASRPPLDYQNPFRDTRKAPGEMQQIKALNNVNGAHGIGTNNTTHWLGTLRS